MWRNGWPRISRTVIALTAMMTGRRMTKIAILCQKPSSCASVERLKIVSASTLRPSAASSAGRTTTENIPARKATATPA